MKANRRNKLKKKANKPKLNMEPPSIAELTRELPLHKDIISLIIDYCEKSFKFVIVVYDDNLIIYIKNIRGTRACGMIDWGDGSVDVIDPDFIKYDGGNRPFLSHFYKYKKEYSIELTGNIELCFEYHEILDIKRWGDIIITNGHKMFYGCVRLIITALDSPNLEYTNNLSSMFEHCRGLNGDLSKWKVDKVTNMRKMFKGCSSFNGDISRWRVDNVTNMSSMFKFCIVFNRDLSNWNVDNVTNMKHMFYGCHDLPKEMAWVTTADDEMYFGCPLINWKDK